MWRWIAWVVSAHFVMDCYVSNVKIELATSIIGGVFAATVNIVRGLFGSFWVYFSFVAVSPFHTKGRFSAVLGPVTKTLTREILSWT